MKQRSDSPKPPKRSIRSRIKSKLQWLFGNSKKSPEETDEPQNMKSKSKLKSKSKSKSQLESPESPRQFPEGRMASSVECLDWGSPNSLASAKSLESVLFSESRNLFVPPEPTLGFDLLREREPSEPILVQRVEPEPEHTHDFEYVAVFAGWAQHRADRERPPAAAAAAAAFWQCARCTFHNLPLLPGCEVCGTERPEDYKIPANYKPSRNELKWANGGEFGVSASPEVRAAANPVVRAKAPIKRDLLWNDLRHADELTLVLNDNEFECRICFTRIEAGQGARLNSCLHEFCMDCLRGHITACQDALVLCPFADDAYRCNEPILDREIETLVGYEAFEKFKQRGVQLFEAATADAFHCKTVNCSGWCLVARQVDFFDVFKCPVCRAVNCVQCKAIHADKTCKQYQDDLRARAENDEAARATQKRIDDDIRDGKAMRCPQCAIVLMKTDGCDGLRCRMCQCEICWATKGRRWGPKGRGDTSGGCRCRVNGKLCAPNCLGCH